MLSKEARALIQELSTSYSRSIKTAKTEAGERIELYNDLRTVLYNDGLLTGRISNTFTKCILEARSTTKQLGAESVLVFSIKRMLDRL
jgi:hypothetical protein